MRGGEDNHSCSALHQRRLGRHHPLPPAVVNTYDLVVATLLSSRIQTDPLRPIQTHSQPIHNPFKSIFPPKKRPVLVRSNLHSRVFSYVFSRCVPGCPRYYDLATGDLPHEILELRRGGDQGHILAVHGEAKEVLPMGHHPRHQTGGIEPTLGGLDADGMTGMNAKIAFKKAPNCPALDKLILQFFMTIIHM